MRIMSLPSVAALALLLGLAAAHLPAMAGALSSASAEYRTVVNGAPDARRQGALYRVKRDGQAGYLFGTIHVGSPSFYPLAPEVSRALANASQLVVELDTRDNAAFHLAVARHGSYGKGDDISRHVSPETLDSLRQALHAVGITLASVAHLKPWLLANRLMGLELERSGYARSHGLETYLLANAQARGTEVAELESADYQLALFDTLDDADAEAYLRDSLRDLADGTSLRKAKNLIDAWSSGDTIAQDGLIHDATGDATVSSVFTRRTLLAKRNPEMAARIELLLQGGRIAFVGVGLLHLLGDDGLPQLLAQRGYQVERVY